MRYRGFIITSTPDSGIERYDRQSSQDVLCNGYYCQIYDGDDDQYANRLMTSASPKVRDQGLLLR